jgi:hypothetical protein
MYSQDPAAARVLPEERTSESISHPPDLVAAVALPSQSARLATEHSKRCSWQGSELCKVRDTCSLRVGDDAVSLLWSIPPNRRFRVPYVEATPRIDHDSWDEGAEEAACVAAMSTRAKVVVCGGWRMFSTTLLYEKAYDNRTFLENVLQWLARRDSLRPPSD